MMFNKLFPCKRHRSKPSQCLNYLYEPRKCQRAALNTGQSTLQAASRPRACQWVSTSVCLGPGDPCTCGSYCPELRGGAGRSLVDPNAILRLSGQQHANSTLWSHPLPLECGQNSGAALAPLHLSRPSACPSERSGPGRPETVRCLSDMQTKGGETSRNPTIFPHF